MTVLNSGAFMLLPDVRHGWTPVSGDVMAHRGDKFSKADWICFVNRAIWIVLKYSKAM